MLTKADIWSRTVIGYLHTKPRPLPAAWRENLNCLFFFHFENFTFLLFSLMKIVTTMTMKILLYRLQGCVFYFACFLWWFHTGVVIITQLRRRSCTALVSLVCVCVCLEEGGGLPGNHGLGSSGTMKWQGYTGGGVLTGSVQRHCVLQDQTFTEDFWFHFYNFYFLQVRSAGRPAGPLRGGRASCMWGREKERERKKEGKLKEQRQVTQNKLVWLWMLLLALLD